MTMADARDFLLRMEGVTVTLQTLYNWATNGRRGVVLKTKTKLGQRYTTQRWIREFLSGIG